MSPAVKPCRFCHAPLDVLFCDLGMSPLSNSYVPEERLGEMEPFYPLRAFVCSNCLLVQVEEFALPEEIFSEYAYFSSYSSSWLEHARAFAEAAIERFGLDANSSVVEVASNDGYLLKEFAARGIPVLGIEPAVNVARVAQADGIPTRMEFFGRDTAEDVRRDGPADLLVGNNVLAHVPDLNDFVSGLALLLAPGGAISLEFPHLMRLVEEDQFDTIYHEHFSYFSLLSARRVLRHHGLEIFDVEEIPTHGGSLRVYAHHSEAVGHPRTERVSDLLERELAAGYENLDTYSAFAARAHERKRELLSFLIEAKREGRSVVGYGAPANGNTLLNFCGIRTDFLDYTVDRNPHKQGHYLPGTHIPIRPPEEIDRTQPDYVLILPWNLREEIMEEMAHIRDWGGRFVVRTPDVTVVG